MEKEIIHFVIDEITAIDGQYRLEPISICNPFVRSKVHNSIFIRTCEKFKIKYDEKDLKPEGEKQAKQIYELIKKT